jgi:hypothetical protein
VSGQYSIESIGSEETQEKLRELVQIAKLLGQKYEAVVTNPPYMGSSGMDAKLSEFVKQKYPDTKSDLFACCIEKWNSQIKKNGYNCMVTMQSWMFLSSFEKMRTDMLATKMIATLMHMENMVMGIAFGTAVTVIGNYHVNGYKGTYNQIKLQDIENGSPKEFPVKGNRFAQVSTDNFAKIPGSPVAYWVSDRVLRCYTHNIIYDYANPCKGIDTGDNNLFLRLWHEISVIKMFIPDGHKLIEQDFNSKKWFPYNKGGNYKKWYGNNEYVLDWENNGFALGNFSKSNLRNKERYFNEGITWSTVTSGNSSFRYFTYGFLFDNGGSCLFANEKLLYIQGMLNSCVSKEFLSIQPTINNQPGTIGSLPLIITDSEDTITNFVLDNNNIAREDWDSFETSWDFQHHPLIPTPQMKSEWQESQFADSRMERLGSLKWNYERWETECNDRFNQLKANEEELNRIFIDIYGLQDELTPEVEDKDVTVRKADLGRDIRSFISYAVGCMFGRYSLAKEGLMFAGGQMTDIYQYHSGMLDGSFTLDGTFPMDGQPYYYLEGDDYLIDGDNIIPITDEEYFPDDIVGRFVDFVKTVYGEDSLEENLNFIADALGNKGDTARVVIRNYFLKDFYADHLKIYQKRPIYWLFDSGKQNGFKALIYMHRYDADTVGRVRTDYLHRAQKYVETAMQSAQYTIESTSSVSDKSKATKAVAKYTKQLAEMQLYDEAIAHIANRRIEIDLDDGVKVNYAKFQGVEVAQEGKKTVKVDLLAPIK